MWATLYEENSVNGVLLSNKTEGTENLKGTWWKRANKRDRMRTWHMVWHQVGCIIKSKDYGSIDYSMMFTPRKCLSMSATKPHRRFLSRKSMAERFPTSFACDWDWWTGTHRAISTSERATATGPTGQMQSH